MEIKNKILFITLYYYIILYNLGTTRKMSNDWCTFAVRKISRVQINNCMILKKYFCVSHNLKSNCYRET